MNVRCLVRSKMAASAAFTLVEIMIVVALVGLLSMLALPSMVSARRRSRETRALRDLTVIASAVEMLVWDTGLWPGPSPPDQTGNPEVWDLSVPEAGLVQATAAFVGWRGPYLKKVPTDPWGKTYFLDPDYTLGGAVVPVVGSFGPNGVGPNVYDADDVVVVLETRSKP